MDYPTCGELSYSNQGFCMPPPELLVLCGHVFYQELVPLCIFRRDLTQCLYHFLHGSQNISQASGRYPFYVGHSFYDMCDHSFYLLVDAQSESGVILLLDLYHVTFALLPSLMILVIFRTLFWYLTITLE